MSGNLPRTALVRQFSWVSTGYISGAGFRAVSLILLARALTPTEFGLFSAVVSLGLVLQAISDFGLAKLVVRERSRLSGGALVVGALRLNTLFSLTLGVILFLGLLLLGLLGNAFFLWMIPLSLSMSGEKNADTWLGVVIADGDAKINSVNLMGRRAISLAVFTCGLAFEVNPVGAFCVAEAFAAGISAWFAHVYVKRILAKRSHLPWRNILRSARPYWVASLASQARNFDVIITSFVAGSMQAGYYSAAARLTTPLQILSNSLSVVILPVAARGASRRRLMQIIAASTLALTSVYLMLAAMIPILVPIILGEPYLPAVKAIQVVVLGLPFAAFSALANAALQGRGRQRLVAIVAVVTTGFCLISIWLGGTNAGAVGAALGVSSSYVAQSMLLTVAVVRSRKLADKMQLAYGPKS